MNTQKIPLSTKISLWTNNFDINPIEAAKRAKYDCINYYVNKLVETHDKKTSENDIFRFVLLMEPKEINNLRYFLKKHKKFIINHIKENGSFSPSHLYQFYLYYIPYELTEFEKYVFLNGYISTLTDIKGPSFSNQKRKKLEQVLGLNNH